MKWNAIAFKTRKHVIKKIEMSRINLRPILSMIKNAKTVKTKLVPATINETAVELLKPIALKIVEEKYIKELKPVYCCMACNAQLRNRARKFEGTL